MDSVLISIIAFVFVIGILVFIHEAGHFSIAKLFKVHVETFSLGFGPRLWGFKRGETDYRLSAIPLGGYVKMLGENPDEMEEAKGLEGALSSKPGWQRFLIFVAGPTANVVLAVLLPAAIFMVSYETPAYRSEPARAEFVATGSPAEKAGLQKGDLIVAFDGRENPTWSDVEDITLIKPGKTLPLVVERNGQQLRLTLELGSQILSGETIGFTGLLPDYGGDGVEVQTVEEDRPAAAAGLRAGDKIVGVGDLTIDNIFELKSVVGRAVGQSLKFTVLRGGETLEMTMEPFLDEVREEGRVGFAPTPFSPPLIVTPLGPVAAVREAVNENIRILWIMKEAFASVLDGQRSMKDTFAGPIGIAQFSGQAAQRGFGDLLRMMAVLSLSLGIFNLFPIPVLDGGQVMMLILEKSFGWFGGELSVALREKIQTVGFAIIALLMGYIIYADIARLIQ